MAKNNLKDIHIKLTEGEMEMLKAMKKNMGYLRIIEVIRDSIRINYRQQFPPYKQHKTDKAVKKVGEKELLTPEQRCEQMGGIVDTVEGMCVIPYGKFGHMKLKKPLSMV